MISQFHTITNVIVLGVINPNLIINPRQAQSKLTINVTNHYEGFRYKLTIYENKNKILTGYYSTVLPPCTKFFLLSEKFYFFCHPRKLTNHTLKRVARVARAGLSSKYLYCFSLSTKHYLKFLIILFSSLHV
ncbi:unnamed protein product [Rhizophagus irregularis]|nr:unnamed protein product [Rhizophagus irregularis]CAB5392735.1 unnamed protein product [Rhizophagus irregularis]